MLLLQRRPAPGARSEPETVQVSSIERVQELESQLHETRESLQASIEELQASSEEQQSINEELVASNEELQSTNEELHSVNEELFMVNTEYRKRNEDLLTVTADLDNLLRSTEVATLYLDRELCIRRFTASAVRLLPLREQDIGRPLADFGHPMDVDLSEEAAQVLQWGKPVEREGRDRQGTWLLIRLSPYTDTAGEPQGVLITMVDVTRIKNAEEAARLLSQHLQESNQRLESQATSLENYFSIVAHDLKRPLLGLDGMITLARESLRASRTEDAETQLARAEQSITTLTNVLEAMMWLATQSAADLTPSEVEVSSWLHQFLAPFRERSEQQGVRFQSATDGSSAFFARGRPRACWSTSSRTH